MGYLLPVCLSPHHFLLFANTEAKGQRSITNLHLGRLDWFRLCTWPLQAPEVESSGIFTLATSDDL